MTIKLGFRDSLLSYSVGLSIIRDHFGESRRDILSSSNASNGVAFGIFSSSSPTNVIAPEFQVTSHYLSNFSPWFPELNLGVQVLIWFKDYDTQSSGSTETTVTLGETKMDARIVPFLLTSLSYEFRKKGKVSFPIEIGYRIPFLNSYRSSNWAIIDVQTNETVLEEVTKSGLASIIRFGLRINL